MVSSGLIGDDRRANDLEAGIHEQARKEVKGVVVKIADRAQLPRRVVCGQPSPLNLIPGPARGIDRIIPGGGVPLLSPSERFAKQTLRIVAEWVIGAADDPASSELVEQCPIEAE